MADELPPPLDLLWSGGGSPARERRPGLSLERVVGAAVELADADGLEAVSMARVAKRLGFTTMSLYRHVRSKDELVALMIDSGALPPEPSVQPSAGWRPKLERWSWDLLSVVSRHPWILGVQLSRSPFGPNRLAWLDRGLSALVGTGLTEDEKAAIVLLLNSYVFGEARLNIEFAEPMPDMSVLDPLVDADRFPALRRAMEAGIFDPSKNDRDAEFAFGLGRVLDGVEKLVEQRG